MIDIEILQRTQDDIFNIIEYGTAEHGEAQAHDYVGKKAARINWLSANPRFGPVHSELRGGIRSIRQGQHRIYYKASTKELTVIRILHVSMDIRVQFD